MNDPFTIPLFGQPASDPPPAALACQIEIAATMSEALAKAKAAGLTRETVCQRMSHALGEPMSIASLNAYTAASDERHEINLRRAIAFDTALGADVLLGLYARKRGGRRIVSDADAALLELGRVTQQKKELAERERLLQVLIRGNR